MTGIVRQKTSMPARIAPRGERLRAVTDDVREFLVFSVGDELMGLPLASVREILKVVPVTQVPRAPEDVLGILSVRGRITTVLDLRRRLRLPAAATTRHARILLVQTKGEIMGARVDAVHHVERLREDEIEPPAIAGGDLPDHVLGIGRPRRVRTGTESDATSTVIVLFDPHALLSMTASSTSFAAISRAARGDG